VWGLGGEQQSRRPAQARSAQLTKPQLTKAHRSAVLPHAAFDEAEGRAAAGWAMARNEGELSALRAEVQQLLRERSYREAAAQQPFSMPVTTASGGMFRLH
jgi:2'-5' RNA ligase